MGLRSGSHARIGIESMNRRIPRRIKRMILSLRVKLLLAMLAITLIASLAIVSVWSYQDLASIDAHSPEGRLRLLVLVFVTLIPSMLGALLVLEMLVLRRTRRLIAATGALTQGDFELPVPRGANDEIGVLIHEFNNMRATLQADISEREANEKVISELNANLEHLVLERTRELSGIIRGSGQGIITITERGEIMSFNPAAERMFGYTEQQMTGRNIKLLMPDEVASRHDHYLAEYKRTGAKRLVGAETELVAQRSNGEQFPIIIAINPYESKEGTRFVGLIMDNSERKRNENNLQLAREQALASSKAKSEFLAAMSHEIRTPMNGVIGTLDLLAQTSLAGEQKNMLVTIRDSALALLRIIDDILDFSKIEAGKLEFEQTSFSVAGLMDSAATLLAPAAQKRNVRLEIFTDPAICQQQLGDPSRLRQILLNLGSNAIKFSDRNREGGGLVTMRAESLDHDTTRFVVADNGIGMTAQTVSGLFSPFTQADQSTTRRFGGTGLGLSITRSLVEGMGGSIAVSSIVGEGSEFRVELPLACDHDDQSNLPGLRGISVLAVVNDSIETELLRSYTEAAGGSIRFASDCAAVPGIIDAERPDVLVLGTELEFVECESFLQDLASRLDTLTLRCLRMSRNRSRGEGMLRDSMSIGARPLLRGEFLAAMLQSAAPPSHEQEGSTVVPQSNQPEPASSKLPILLVEDNEINREVIISQLEVLGYSVFAVNDGVAGLRCWQEGEYSLVLTDCHMPNMDGLQMSAAIRRIEQETGAPRAKIIAITANAIEGERQKCLDAGMDDYITKPVRLDYLGEVLARWLGKP
jgi:PAS domain S-box-containing protein